jgi:type IV pilus assembly protein PilZ
MRKTIPVGPSLRVEGVTSRPAPNNVLNTQQARATTITSLASDVVDSQSERLHLPAATSVTTDHAAKVNAGKPEAHIAVLDVDVRDKKQLQAIYMPFLVNGGVFVPATKEYEIGETVYLQLHLFKEGDVYPVAGQVAWVTPKHAVYKRIQGIGVHFMDDEVAQRTKQKIEELLQSATSSDKSTHTL